MPLPGLNISTPLVADGFPGIIPEIINSPPFFFIEKRSENTGKKEIEVFSDDLAKGGNGDDYQLRLIVQGYFALKEWDKAAEEFRRFLELPRSKDYKARAQFYLGQVNYFRRKPREALFQFLLAQEQYPAECHSWIQAVLGDFVHN
jgi:TolA-binding protein